MSASVVARQKKKEQREKENAAMHAMFKEDELAVAVREAERAEERKAKEAEEAAQMEAEFAEKLLVRWSEEAQQATDAFKKAAVAVKTLVRADADSWQSEAAAAAVAADSWQSALQLQLTLIRGNRKRRLPPNQDAFTEEHQASVGSETMVPPPARALTDTEEYVSV